VTQQFNTDELNGAATLNVTVIFAQFEREITGERIRDKIAASKKKGHMDGRECTAGLWTPRSARSQSTCRGRALRRIFALYS